MTQEECKIFLPLLPSPTSQIHYFPPKPPRAPLRTNKNFPKKPFFELLSDSWETAHAESIPRNRLFLKSLCNGKGTLKKDRLNQVYLEIDRKFFTKLRTHLQSKKAISSSFLDLTDTPNFSVISFREAFFHNLSFPIEEPHQEFLFEIEGLYSVTHPSEFPELKQIWFLKVRSSALEELRKKHFLPALPNGHPFCIPLAVQYSERKREPLSFYRISPSIGAA